MFFTIYCIRNKQFFTEACGAAGNPGAWNPGAGQARGQARGRAGSGAGSGAGPASGRVK